jgi:hypothetical protein
MQWLQEILSAHTCALFVAPLGLPGPLAAFLLLEAPLLEEWPLRCCIGLRLMKRVASSRKESRGPEQNWSSSDKLAAGASSRGRGLRMVEDAMTAAADVLLVQWQVHNLGRKRNAFAAQWQRQQAQVPMLSLHA